MGSTVVKTRRLTKRYPAVTAVDNVDLAVECGEILGLVGPNGAGKTTLLRMLSTLLPPSDGVVEILGMDIRRDPLEVKRHVGYLPDFFNLYGDLKLWEMLHFFAEVYGVPSDMIERRVAEVLDYVDLTCKRDSYAKNLSRGMTQRLGLATLLVRDLDMLLLDEPASGLDPVARIGLRNVLKRLAGEGKTIIISSHILTELDDFCTHVAFMDHGVLKAHDKISDIQRGKREEILVSLRVLDGGDSVPGALDGMDDVSIASRKDGLFKIAVNGGLPEVAKLNQVLVAAGVDVVELREEKAGLEDIFMDLTGDGKEGAA